jgi:hypothetical protein
MAGKPVRKRAPLGRGSDIEAMGWGLPEPGGEYENPDNMLPLLALRRKYIPGAARAGPGAVQRLNDGSVGAGSATADRPGGLRVIHHLSDSRAAGRACPTPRRNARHETMILVWPCNRPSRAWNTLDPRGHRPAERDQRDEHLDAGRSRATGAREFDIQHYGVASLRFVAKVALAVPPRRGSMIRIDEKIVAMSTRELCRNVDWIET